MNLLNWCDQQEQQKSDKNEIKTIIKFTIKPKIIVIILNTLNPHDTPVKTAINHKNITTKYSETKLLKKENTNNHKTAKINKNKINDLKYNDESVKLLEKQQQQYHQHTLFRTGLKGELQYQQQYAYQFLITVNLKLTNHNKINKNTKSTTIRKTTHLTCQQHITKPNNNYNIMTTTTSTSSLTTSMVATMTNSSTRTATTITPTWSNVYELTTIGSIDTNTNISNNNNNNIISPFKKLNTTITTNNSSSISNDTYNDDYSDESEVLQTIEYMSTILSFYYIPIIVGTGSIGNILSVFVFFKTKLRKLSSSFYLAALAVSDTCFLLGLFAQWLNFFDVRIYNREYFCQFFTFFSNLACFCSVWFVVAFTVERFIAVMYPLRRQTMCTVRRAKMVLVGLTILGCLHCIPFWIYSTTVYSSKVGDTICDIRSEYKDYILLFNYWDTIVVFAVPFTTIVILNTFTGCTVWKFATVRRTLTMQKMKTQHLPLHGTMSSPSSSCSARESGSVTTGITPAAAPTTTAATTYRITTSSSLKRQKSTSCANPTHSNGQHSHIITHHHHHHHHNPHQQQHTHPNRATMIKHAKSGNNDYSDVFSRKSRRRKVTNSSQLKVTKMLLIVSTVFVCLNLPSFIMRMITYLETQSSANEKTTVVLQYIFQLLFITNFGINFVLYCVSGQNFRKAVLSMFRKVSTTQRDGTTQITVSEYYRNSGGMGSCGAGTSMRKRTMSQNCWNEIHELQHLK